MDARAGAPQSILVACDFSAPAQRAAEWSRWLHARLHAAICLVHVIPDADASLGARWMTPDERERLRAFYDQELIRLADEVFGPEAQVVRRRVESGTAVDRLIAVASELRADLICVGTAGKGAVGRALLGSTARDLVRRSSVPVLTVM